MNLNILHEAIEEACRRRTQADCVELFGPPRQLKPIESWVTAALRVYRNQPGAVEPTHEGVTNG